VGVVLLIIAIVALIAKKVSSGRVAKRRQRASNEPTVQLRRFAPAEGGDVGMNDVLVGEEQPGVAIR